MAVKRVDISWVNSIAPRLSSFDFDTRRQAARELFAVVRGGRISGRYLADVMQHGGKKATLDFMGWNFFDCALQVFPPHMRMCATLVKNAPFAATWPRSQLPPWLQERNYTIQFSDRRVVLEMASIVTDCAVRLPKKQRTRFERACSKFKQAGGGDRERLRTFVRCGNDVASYLPQVELIRGLRTTWTRLGCADSGITAVRSMMPDGREGWFTIKTRRVFPWGTSEDLAARFLELMGS